MDPASLLKELGLPAAMMFLWFMDHLRRAKTQERLMAAMCISLNTIQKLMIEGSSAHWQSNENIQTDPAKACIECRARLQTIERIMADQTKAMEALDKQ